MKGRGAIRGPFCCPRNLGLRLDFVAALVFSYTVMFSPEYRAEARRRLIAMAEGDPRIGSAAAVGGSAQGEHDRWSDLDLTFGVASASVDEVLADWTDRMRREFDAVTLFDLVRGSSVYRVFLLPGSLQVDLSFTPAAEFGALGPRFALLFGQAVEREQPSSPAPPQEFGMAAHHAVRARLCIERGRLWQAEYWISLVRDHALTLASMRFGLDPSYGRGFDRLPRDVRELAQHALVRTIEREELSRALRAAAQLLLHEGHGVHEDEQQIAALLRELIL